MLAREGMLAGTVYRPAARTRIDAAALGLPDRDVTLAADLATGRRTAADPELSALPATTRAHVIELAQAYVQYQLDTGAWSHDTAAPKALVLIRARGALNDVPPPVDPPPPATRPDQGHLNARLTLGAGATAGHPFWRSGPHPSPMAGSTRRGASSTALPSRS